MIRFIEVNGEGGKSFSFFDTVADKFCEFSGSQIWSSIGEFRFDFKGENIERYLELIPEYFFEKGIFHEVLESGRFERQIVRLEKNDISMNFRFYKNKYLNGQKIRILFPKLED